MKRQQIIVTPCGSFYSVGGAEAMFKSLPDHRFGWSLLEFCDIYDKQARLYNSTVVLDLTR